MAKKTEADVALEMYQSVMQSQNKQKRLKSSTFWHLFHVKARQKTIVERIEHIINEQGLKITVKSGAILGKEKKSDWIILTPRLLPEPKIPSQPVYPSEWPTTKWFEMIQTREYESEREVETYFIIPLLEKLGYEYDDIVIGYTFPIFKGVKKTKAEADVVVFNGSSRKTEDVLLVIEAKKSDTGINRDHIGQAKSYSIELLPACYIISNGQQTIVFQFNGTLIPDERVIGFDRSELEQEWGKLYSYISKEATIHRKQWMGKRLSQISTQ